VTYLLDHERRAKVFAALQAETPRLCVVSRQTSCNDIRHFLTVKRERENEIKLAKVMEVAYRRHVPCIQTLARSCSENK
jgi:hypothetical protein